MQETPRTALVVNLQSRRGEQWFPFLEPKLREREVAIHEVLPIRDPVHLEHALEKAIAKGATRLLVAGGDGTFSAVARLIHGKPITLGVIPSGTGNQFARDLEIRSDLDHACEVIAGGIVKPVDLGFVNGHPFLNVASFGLTSQLVDSLSVVGKRRWGRLVYVLAFVRAWRKTRPLKVTWTSGDLTESFEAMQVVLGNGRFHVGKAPLAPEAHIVDGKLDLYALEGHSRWRFVRYLLRIQSGLHGQLAFVRTLESGSGSVSADPMVHVVVDGEVLTQTPVEFSVLPASLQVLVPPSFQG